MPNLVVGIPDGMHEDAIRYLEEHDIDVIPQQKSKAMGIERLLQETDAVVARSATEVRELPNNSRVKILARTGSGTDNFIQGWDQIRAANIPIINSPGPNAKSVSQQVIAYMLHDAMNLDPIFEASRRGKWTKSSYEGRLLDGYTMGVIGGAGLIGRAVIAKVNTFGMRVLAQDIDPGTSNDQVRFVDLDTLLGESDYISVHTPFTGEPIITSEQLAMMKPDTMLINAARGGVVDESALVQALKKGVIRRAYVDVFTSEPFDKNPSKALKELITLESTFCTPHLGASTPEGQKQGSEIIARKLVNYLRYGFLEDACNMDIDTNLDYLRGFFHRLGMFTKQYSDGDIKSIKLLLDGELMATGDKIRIPLVESYLCGLLSDGNYINPLNVRSATSGLEHSITNVNERKSDVVRVEFEGSRGKYVLEADYKKEEVVGIGYTSSDGSVVYYKTHFGLDGNIVLFEHDDVAGAIHALIGPIKQAGINIDALSNQRNGGRGLTVAQLEEPLKDMQPFKGPLGDINVYQAKSLILPPKDVF